MTPTSETADSAAVASPGNPWRMALVLFVLALAARLGTFLVFPHPAYPDASYYATVAREIVAGHGFSIPYLSSFIDVGSIVPAVGVLPTASNALWMPLASIVQVPFVFLLGPTDLAAALPFILLGALIAPLTYAIGRDLLGRAGEGRARFAAVLIAVPGGVAAYLSQPDNFALFALLVTAALWLLARAARGKDVIRFAALAGVCAGMAFLARNDGLILTVIGGFTLLVIGWRSRRALDRLTPAIAFSLAWFALAGPWLARQLSVFGALSPASASGRIVWARDGLETYGADGPLGPAHLLDWGLDNLLGSRLLAAGTAAYLLGVALFLIILVVPFIAGLRHRRTEPLIRLYSVYLGVYLAYAVLIAAPQLGSGNFIHSAFALLPIGYVLAADGLERIFDAVARRLPRWDRVHGARRWRVGVLVIALALSMITSLTGSVNFRFIRNWESAAASWLVTNAPDARVMSPDPGGLWVIAEIPGIQTPASDLAIIEQAVRSYDIRFIALERSQTVPALRPLFAAEPDGRPAWLGEPVASGDDKGGRMLWAIFPVIEP